MRLGYGYKRRRSDFDHANVDKVYIDHPGTRRDERTEMLVNGMRRDDVLVLLAPGDLGAGGEIPLLRKELKAMGVSIEIAEGPARETASPGRPAAFKPSDDQVRRLKKLWTDGRYGGRYVLDAGCEMAGWKLDKAHREKMRQWLYNKFGARGV